MEQFADRGRLLYQEEWSRTKRFHDRSHVVMGGTIMAMSILLAVVLGGAFISGSVSDPGMAAAMFSLIVGVLFFMGFGMLSQELKRAPFKIYEQGFTLPSVPIMKGWRREEEFVPWSRLDAIHLEEQVFMSINIKKIKLGYDGTKSLDLSMGLLDEPFAAMKALNLVVPSKMDERFKAYLGTDQERKLVKYPLPEGSGRDFRWVIPVILQIFISVMIGTLGWSLFSSGRWSGLLFFGPFFGIMSVVFFWMLLMVDDQAQTERIAKKATATEAGLVLPATMIGKIARVFRPVVPYSEIRVVRTVVEPMFFSHRAEFETFNGEKFRVPYQVYELASRRKEFFYEYFEYINKGPGLPSEKVMPRSWTGTIGLFILFCSPIMLAPLINFDFSGPMELARQVMLLVVFSVLLPLLSFSMRMIQKRQRLAEGLVAMKDKITITGAPAKFGNIPRSDFVSARIARDMWTLHCEILTVKGRIKLGHSAAEKLLVAGYPVEGAENLTPLAKLAPGKTAGAAPTDEKPRHARMEPGQLIAEQDPASLARYKGKFYRWGIVLTVIGVALMPLPFLIELESYLLLNLMIFIFLPLLIGPLFIAAARKTRPARIHDNGIVLTDGNRKEGVVFVPYGRIKGYADLTAPLAGDVVRLQIEGGFYNLPKSFPGFNAIFEDMKKKFGRPEYDSADFQQHTNKTFRTLEIGIYAFALVLGYGGAAAFNSINGYFLPPSFVGKMFLFGTPLLLLIVAYGLHFLEFRKHNYPGNADLRKAGALISVSLVLFAAGWVINIPDPDPGTVYAAEVPGSWVPLNGSVENQTIEVKENISVQPGEHLVISNSTITFPLTKLKEFRIYVSKGGSLEVTDSLIRSNSSEFGLKFSIFGRAVLRNSTFTGLYASPYYNNGVGGLEIFSSDVSVLNCTIKDNKYNGILVARCSPLIEGCDISGNGDDGIELQQASPVVRNCSIARNDWAVMVGALSSPRLEGNLIEDNNHGIVVEGSSPVIINNTIRNNRAFAIKYYDDSRPRISGNTLVANEAGIVQATALESYFSICAAIVTVVGVLACAVMLGRIRKKRQAEELKSPLNL